MKKQNTMLPPIPWYVCAPTAHSSYDERTRSHQLVSEASRHSESLHSIQPKSSSLQPASMLPSHAPLDETDASPLFACIELCPHSHVCDGSGLESLEIVVALDAMLAQLHVVAHSRLRSFTECAEKSTLDTCFSTFWTFFCAAQGPRHTM